MSARSSDRFPTIRTEGAILPVDLLQRIAAGDNGLDGLTPASYHLIEGEKLNEATNRAWNRLLGVWNAFQHAAEKLPAGNPGANITLDRWLLPLWQELGYGRLVPAKPIELEGKSYPVSHVWSHAPIHLVGCRIDLDRRTTGDDGSSQPSPHSLVQELVNRSEDFLWAFVSNGLRLRILRDSSRLTRQAYVEFDLQAIFDGKVYTDFALLWRLCHESRVEAEKPHDWWLERWSKAAQQQGLRVLDQLRDGVERAIAALGRGFLSAPTNSALREKLRIGSLAAQDYYRQLLRLVYRLLFLFVAEDRDLLLSAGADTASRDRYARFYSTAKLRGQAERLRGTQHTDLYQMLHLVMDRLGSANGCPDLDLPALGGFLFSPEALPDLEGCQLANADLLDAVRSLALTSDGHVLRPVDYRNLGSEELGSIYESLLELHPVLNAEAGTFELKTASGHERKTTGSYYTPTSLITCLLDSALDPVLDEAARQPDAERAIRNLKVCDPACGSGHFLIAAAHRIAKRLAFVRTGEEESPPQAVRTALRDVIGHCVYGVDINPMAVELCKVALWMEALEPGKPLSFLEHHIQCGNSLLGAAPALLDKGIQDEAFTAIEGDIKTRCSQLKKQNKGDRRDFEQGQGRLFETLSSAESLTDEFASLNRAPDGSIGEITDIQRRYAHLVGNLGYQNARLWADTWCAAFVWRKDDSELGRLCPTERDFRNVERQGQPGLLPHVRAEVQRLRDQYQFFHWHLAFPDVFRLPGKGETSENEQTGWSGGFDVVLGNPPWEHTEMNQKEWFAERRPGIAQAPNDAARRAMIERLSQEHPSLYAAFREDIRTADGINSVVRSSGRYPMCGRGRANTYSLFAELNRSLVRLNGRVGCIVPAGIATDDTTKAFFQQVIRTGELVSLFGFENEEFIFPGVHHATRFCLLSLRSVSEPLAQTQTDFVFFARHVEDLEDPERRFQLGVKDLELINPNTSTCSTFRYRRDAQLTKAIHSRVPVLVRLTHPQGNPWGLTFKQGLFNMATDSGVFRTAAQLEDVGWTKEGNVYRRDTDRYLPLYEAKMFSLFDHRHGSVTGSDDLRQLSGVPAEGTSESDHDDPRFVVMPRYWVPEEAVATPLTDADWRHPFLLCFRDVARSTDARTAIHSLLPIVGVGHKAPILMPETERADLIGCFLANVNSLVLDYVTRQKVGGASLGFFIYRQLPVLPPDAYLQPVSWAGPRPLSDWVLPRVLELAYTAWDMQPFAIECGYDGPAFHWNSDRRFLIRCELDAAFLHLYGLARDEATHVLQSFRVINLRDVDKHGRHRTSETIMGIYDALAEAVRIGHPYQTSLDPPPADPGVAHEPRRKIISLERGRAVLDILLLLEAWGRPVSMLALEPALVLMRNDAARQSRLRRPLTAVQKKQLAGEPRIVSGLDVIYRGMLANGAIRRVGENAFELAQPELLHNAPQADRQRAAESVRAISQWPTESEAYLAVAEEADEVYEVALS